MSDCRIYGEKLSAFLEGALPEAEGWEVEKHLENCGDCRSVLQDLKKTGDLLARLEEKDAPPWFTQKVMARVKQEAGEKKGLLQKLFFPLRIKIPIEVAASLLVAVLAWQLYQASPPEMKALPEAPMSPQVLHRAPALKDEEKKAPAGVPLTARERKETPSDAVSKTEGLAASGGQGAGKVKVQEETLPGAPRDAAEAPATEEKKAAAADRMEAARPDAASLKKGEPAELQPTPAPAPAPAPAMPAAPRMIERELREKDAMGKHKSEGAKERAQVMGSAARGGPQQVWTVRARDVEAALEKIRKWLQEVGAKSIQEEAGTGRKIISGRVGAGDLDALEDRLKALGELSPKEVPALVVSKDVPVRIEIIQAVP